MARGGNLELSIRIAGRVDRSLTAAINSAQSHVSSFSANVGRLGTAGLAGIGALATGTAATVISCTNEAEKFANGMGDVVKYVSGLADSTGRVSDSLALNPDESVLNGKTYAENYTEVSKAIRDLSTQIPYAQKELQQLAASAGQSGKGIADLYEYDSNGNLSGFLKDVAMMGTAWDIEASQAGDWAAKWEVALGMNHDQIMTLADQINYLGANNATTAAEIGGVVNKVASFGQVAGMAADDTAALATAILAMGVDDAKAASSISRMYTNLNKGASATKAQKEMWESMGMTATQVARGMQKDATGTLISVFDAIKQLPSDNRVAALSTLFGQWAIEAGGKLTTNLDAFTDALESVQDPGNYTGSMNRELAIKMDTPEAVNQMLNSSISALKGEIGESFLPVKKEFSLMMIDAINGARQYMPEISKFANMVANVLHSGVSKIGGTIQSGMPIFMNGLDYVTNNGPKVVSILEKLVAVLAAMKFAPGIENLLGGAGALLFGASSGGNSPGGGQSRRGGLLGTAANLFHGGQNAAATTENAFANIAGSVRSATAGTNGGVRERLANGTVGALSTLQNMSGLLSGNAGRVNDARAIIDTTIMDARMDGAGNVLRNMFAQTRVGQASSSAAQYFGGITSSLGNLRNTRIGGGVANAFGMVRQAMATSPQARGMSGLMSGAAEMVRNAPHWIAGKAGGAASAVAASAPGRVIGGAVGGAAPILTSLGQFTGPGADVLGSIWGPMAGGFGSLFAGAVPVVGAISGIIAVASILGDHLEGIRGIVQNVFGEEGLAVFDTFKGKLDGIGTFISGLFQDGGVANALAPLQVSVANMFGSDAGTAFGGVIQVLQSIMGAAGQIVSFSTGTVKPILMDIFGYITETAVLIILQTFTAAAPAISSIITSIASAVMTGMQIIGSAINFVLPVIGGLVSGFLNIANVVIPAVLSGIQVFSTGISNIVTAIQGIFQGLITFITGVFSMSWSQAWEGIKQIFSNAFQALVDLCKAPINAVVSIINGVISGINGMGFTLPDWLPGGLAGKSFSINLPMLPTFAKGGFTNGVSIAGEAGTEAVISFQNSVRRQNINTWMQAGRMLGVNGSQAAAVAGLPELADLDADENDLIELDFPQGDFSSGANTFQFSPTINIQGSADRAVIESVLADAMQDFEARMDAWEARKQRRKARTVYR